MKKSHHYLNGFSTLLLILLFSSSAFAVFPNNPLPDNVRIDNPLRNESGYSYTYWKTNSLTPPANFSLDDPRNYETFNVVTVSGYRDNDSPTWHKEHGWTISTHGLFGSRGGGHAGVDLAAPIETPVHAVDAGTVSFNYQSGGVIGPWRVNSGAGFYATVTHAAGGPVSFYAHLAHFSRDEGIPVTNIVIVGQQIALSGATGNATVIWNGTRYVIDQSSANLGGPHLHFGVFTCGAFSLPVHNKCQKDALRV